MKKGNKKTVVDVNVVAGVRNALLLSMLPHANEILDIGSGASGFVNFYPFLNCNVTFVDKKHSENDGFLNSRHKDCRFTYIETYSDNLSMLKNDSFDMVIFNHVIEHLTDKQVDGTMKEIHRVLKPGGLLMVGTPNKPARIMVNKYLSNEYHIREYTNAEMIDIHTRHGFTIVENKGIVKVVDGIIHMREQPKTPEEGYLLWFISTKKGKGAALRKVF